MAISVVVVSYNVRAQLTQALASIPRDVPTVVVDNASTDGTVAALRDVFPHVTWLERSRNDGFSVAVNAGVAACDSAQTRQHDGILVLNPDAELPPGAIPHMHKALRRWPQAWAMGFRQVDAANHFQLAFGLAPGIPQEALRRAVQRRLDAGQHWVGAALDRLYRRPQPVAWVAGSSLLVRRRHFDQIGGFDERFFMYFEDIDLCLRLRRLGGSVWYDPSLTVVHRRGQSAGSSEQAAQRARQAYRRSQILFWDTHGAPWHPPLWRAYQRLSGARP